MGTDAIENNLSPVGRLTGSTCTDGPTLYTAVRMGTPKEDPFFQFKPVPLLMEDHK